MKILRILLSRLIRGRVVSVVLIALASIGAAWAAYATRKRQVAHEKAAGELAVIRHQMEREGKDAAITQERVAASYQYAQARADLTAAKAKEIEARRKVHQLAPELLAERARKVGA